MLLYIAGPMTHRPQFNFPAFAEAAADLRRLGYDVINPAEHDSEPVQAAALASTDGSLDANGKIGGETWGQILARDVQLIADKVDGVAFLPEWEESRGARLEAFVALLAGKHRFFYYQRAEVAKSPLWPVVPETIRNILRVAMP